MTRQRTDRNYDDRRVEVLVDKLSSTLEKLESIASFEGMARTRTSEEERMKSIADDPFLSKETVARALDQSIEHVRDLITRGQLKAFKLGRSVRIRKSELDRYVFENAVPKN